MDGVPFLVFVLLRRNEINVPFQAGNSISAMLQDFEFSQVAKVFVLLRRNEINVPFQAGNSISAMLQDFEFSQVAKVFVLLRRNEINVPFQAGNSISAMLQDFEFSQVAKVAFHIMGLAHILSLFLRGYLCSTFIYSLIAKEKKKKKKTPGTFL